MSTTLAAILIALAGVIGVLAVSYTFYVVGRAEDREREASAVPEAPPEPAPEPPAPGEIARERRRHRPPRRPG
jgi:hypothetical protein